MHLDGVLFFPVTPFEDGSVSVPLLERHIEDGLAHNPGGVFVACGTGELHALAEHEYADAVRSAVATVSSSRPVVAGAGGPLPTAVAQVRTAEQAGADAVLLLPPYLVGGPGAGVVAYVEAVASATGLPVIVYQRGQVRFTPESVAHLAQHPNIVGFKDGLGDMELMHSIVLEVRRTVGADFTFFNGLPTAELTVPAYRGIGVPLYSSAVFCFAPEVACAYYDALQANDTAAVRQLATEFYAPLVRLRNQVPGYAVSLVKAGVRHRGLDVGPVRPPLTEPAAAHVAVLERLVDAGLAVVGAAG